MRDGRLAETDKGGQIAHATLPVAQRVDEPHPRGVPQQLEDFSDRVDACGPSSRRAAMSASARTSAACVVWQASSPTELKGWVSGMTVTTNEYMSICSYVKPI